MKNKNIKYLEKYVEIDRQLRNYSTESDYDKYCEEQCIAIENVLQELKNNKKGILSLIISRAKWKQKYYNEKLKNRRLKEIEEENKTVYDMNSILLGVLDESIPKHILKTKQKKAGELADKLRPAKHITPHDFGYWCGQYDILDEILKWGE